MKKTLYSAFLKPLGISPKINNVNNPEVKPRGSPCFILIFLLFILIGCATAPRDTEKDKNEALDSGSLKIALVLDGMGVHAFAGIGAIRVLEDERIPIHLIVGNHMGSLIGALYADATNSFALEWSAQQLDERKFYATSFFKGTDRAYASLNPLKKFSEEKLKTKKIEDLKINFAAVTTNLHNGKTVILDKGSVSDAIIASSSIPGYFPPYFEPGKALVSGSLSAGSGVRVAKELGADLVIAVAPQSELVSFNLKNQKDIVLQTFKIASQSQTETDLEEADIVIKPDLEKTLFDDFSKKRYCLIQGKEAAQNLVQEILSLIESKK
ncbi:MAG TPA: patatin-like phospholipase family protein [Bdellovibrionota bacterium]|nr:patatin-like phospholipase family protein [Bdellovibrionota bacterium]